MNNLLLTVLAIYLIMIVSTYLIVFQRLLRGAVQYPQYQLALTKEVPNYITILYQKPIYELQELGFQCVGYFKVEDMYIPKLEQRWGVLLNHQDSKSYAQINTHPLPDTVNLFSICFYSFFEDRSLLMTLNGRAYGILDQIPKTIIQDPYTISIESHWQTHLDKLKDLINNFFVCELSPEDFLDALQTHLGIYLDHLLNTKKITRIPGTNLYQYTWLTAFKFAFQLSLQSGKRNNFVQRRIKQAQTNSNLKTEIPVELEVQSFYYMQQIEQGVVKRKISNWLMLVSLAAFAASFALFYQGHRLLILIGVIWLHEAGHFLMMKIYGYQDTSIFFLPFFGAAATGYKHDATLTKKFWVLLAGPLPGIIVGIVIALLVNPRPLWLDETISMLILLNLLNLMPILPLDGGKIVNILFFARHPYADVFFKVITVIILVFLGFQIPFFMILAMLVGFSIPHGFRTAKLDAILRKELPFTESNPNNLLYSIFHNIKEHEYDNLPFNHRYNLAKNLIQNYYEGQRKLVISIGLFLFYCFCLIGGILGLVLTFTAF